MKVFMTSYKHARARDAGGIVRFSNTATRHCNNSKTAILFPRASGSVQKRTSVEDHRYISPTLSLCVRGKITLPVTPPAFLHRIFYRQEAHLVPISPLSSFICSFEAVPESGRFSCRSGNSARSRDVIRRICFKRVAYNSISYLSYVFLTYRLYVFVMEYSGFYL